MKGMGMKNVIIGLLLATFSSAAQASKIERLNLVGEWEGVLVKPGPEALQLKAYIINFQLFDDGTLLYKEYINAEKTEGITGTAEKPACPGNWVYEKGVVKSTTDCSKYSGIYHQEIVIGLHDIEEFQDGKNLVVKTDLLPYPLSFLMKKLASGVSNTAQLVLSYDSETAKAAVAKGNLVSTDFLGGKVLVESDTDLGIRELVDTKASPKSVCYLGSKEMAHRILSAMVHNSELDKKELKITDALISTEAASPEMILSLGLEDAQGERQSAFLNLSSCSR